MTFKDLRKRISLKTIHHNLYHRLKNKPFWMWDQQQHKKSASEIWVLGGDWELGVSKGNLTNLAVDIAMSRIDGKGAHHHTIEILRNATGAVLPGHSEQIALTNGNHTDFKGIADITTNGKVKWKAVPIVVHLLNGECSQLQHRGNKN